ncbi:MAG: synthase [Rhodoferax sp.]|nr:synthase [Rhodoferax sp.]
MNAILIVQMTRPPEAVQAVFGEQPDWFREVFQAHGIATRTVCPSDGDLLPEPDAVAGAIITGSWAMVTDRADWSERTAAWVRAMVAAERPLLGVCYGHQLMAHALGGQVDYHPAGPEVGCHAVSMNAAAQGDAFFAALPPQFDAFLTHEQSVLVPPAGATVLGRSDHDPHQILRYGPRAVSVQFHPEFTPRLMGACIERRAVWLGEQGRDMAAMLAGLVPTPHAQGLLHAFAVLAGVVPVAATA